VVAAPVAVDDRAEVVGVTTIRATRVSPASHAGNLRHAISTARLYEH
jgi:hypothetical protein